ncbi:hypothetical protein [Roseovarius sp. THAF9]|uniref:hypothetical protein n=1 Tax=Roseovarius sp. THAF9 TaxID=2587847 RepID=UPI001C12A7B0|nr:hypothetical protein [Roseovarius sp. THAF9]
MKIIQGVMAPAGFSEGTFFLFCVCRFDPLTALWRAAMDGLQIHRPVNCRHGNNWLGKQPFPRHLKRWQRAHRDSKRKQLSVPLDPLDCFATHTCAIAQSKVVSVRVGTGIGTSHEMPASTPHRVEHYPRRFPLAALRRNAAEPVGNVDQRTRAMRRKQCAFAFTVVY